MKNFSLFYISFAFLTLSCSGHSDNPDFDRTLTCDTDKPDQTISEYVSHVSFVVLDSDGGAEFRDIDELVIENGRIYIGDFSSHKIVAYKMFGYAENDYDLIEYSRFFPAYEDKIVYGSFHFDGFTVFYRLSGEVLETAGINFGQGETKKYKDTPSSGRYHSFQDREYD